MTNDPQRRNDGATPVRANDSDPKKWLIPLLVLLALGALILGAILLFGGDSDDPDDVELETSAFIVTSASVG